MSRVVHGPNCPCPACVKFHAPRTSEQLPGGTPLRRALAAMPPWHQALAYALVQLGDLARVLAIRFDPTPAPAPDAAPSEDEAELAQRAAAGDFVNGQ